MAADLIAECARSVIREYVSGRAVDPSRLRWARETLAQLNGEGA